jgi:hypothetical protein
MINLKIIVAIFERGVYIMKEINIHDSAMNLMACA